ncbi:MAG: hypothetical protein B7X40_06175 [Cellulomonas sp. 14-74-6]|nr:MAG: hypothetical protein B7X40_06175 [Cellulomonas sp. 14-74-6]
MSAAPITRTEDVVEIVAGIAVPDPYRWLEADASAPGEVADWQRAQAAHAEETIWSGHDREAVRAVVERGHAGARPELPQAGGGRWFRAEGRRLLVADEPYGPGRALVDLTRFDEPGRTSVLSWFAPSPDGAVLALGVCTDGSEHNRVELIDARTGALRDDAPPELLHSSWGGGISWFPDSTGFAFLGLGSTAHDFRRAAITMLESMGISVEFSHHEAGPGQNEIDLRYADALTTADNIMTFRTVVKEVALEQGVFASFMPKPLFAAPGSGMHTHLSLFQGDKNAFHEAGADLELSKIGRSFIAGLLRHAAEITAVTNQFVNSYKRLWGGAEAPSYICWGHNNRSALVRVPLYKPGKGNSSRVEYRAVDSAANPYLAFAVLLAAGLKGIDEGYELPEGAEDDVWELTDAERRALGIEPLPTSLEAAIEVMERSELVAEALGEHVFDYFLRNKREEWREYRAQVTPFELQRFLPLV